MHNRRVALSILLDKPQFLPLQQRHHDHLLPVPPQRAAKGRLDPPCERPASGQRRTDRPHRSAGARGNRLGHRTGGGAGADLRTWTGRQRHRRPPPSVGRTSSIPSCRPAAKGTSEQLRLEAPLPMGKRVLRLRFATLRTNGDNCTELPKTGARPGVSAGSDGSSPGAAAAGAAFLPLRGRQRPASRSACSARRASSLSLAWSRAKTRNLTILEGMGPKSSARDSLVTVSAEGS